jgi:hypothetical protein
VLKQLISRRKKTEAGGRGRAGAGAEQGGGCDKTQQTTSSHMGAPMRCDAMRYALLRAPAAWSVDAAAAAAARCGWPLAARYAR